MPDQPLHTDFAPAERDSEEAIREQVRLIARHSPRMMLDGLPLPVVVVNAKRQIVFCNNCFEAFAREQGDLLPLGRRPGEALGCENAGLNGGGCGTSRFCRFCGAARAILESLDGAHSVQLCRLTRSRGEPSCLDFQVFAEPLVCEGVSFVLFSVLDVSKELRLESLRRKVLEDVRRRAENINRLYAGVVREQGGESTSGGLFALGYAARMLMEEIDGQFRIFEAEEDRLDVREESVGVVEALRHALACLDAREDAFDLETTCQGLQVRADRQLLGYVLRQVLENGLEAVGGRAPVRIACLADEKTVRIRVGTPAPLRESVRLQIFQRGFSTKGQGRGMGLYHARLLARRYLDGDLAYLEQEPGAVFELRLRRD